MSKEKNQVPLCFFLSFTSSQKATATNTATNTALERERQPNTVLDLSYLLDCSHNGELIYAPGFSQLKTTTKQFKWQIMTFMIHYVSAKVSKCVASTKIYMTQYKSYVLQRFLFF